MRRIIFVSDTTNIRVVGITIRHLKTPLLFSLLFFCTQRNLSAQNIFSGERVQVTGSFNSYRTLPYGTDSRTTTYRRVSITTGTPTDGRGQWATTMNVQNSGGDLDAVPTNMTGGNGNGFLFISGPASDRFLNKWVFSNVGQATVNEINGNSAYNSGVDMGLNLSTPGYYSFVFNDCGYTLNNSRFYVGYTAAMPVNVTKAGQSFVGDLATIQITTSAAPSAGENIYVRYRIANNDFTSGTTILQATGSVTTWSVDIPSVTCTTTIYYYVFSSTRSLVDMNNNNEMDRTLAALRYDDNGGANYTLKQPPATSSTTVSSCTPYTWNGVTYRNSGTYTFNTNTAFGCDSVATLNLTVFANISSTFTKSDAACNGLPTGSITITPTAGTPPYSYRIGTTGSFVTSNTFSGLRAGDYRISIRDANGCDGISAQITISQQNTITGNFNKTDISCYGGTNGSITVSPTGGTAPFTFRNGTSGSFVSGNTFTGLAAGVYRVYLQDANGCSINSSVTLQQPAQVNGTITSTSTKCFGSKDGSITVSPTTGVSPFTYRISTSSIYVSNNTFTGLKTGQHIIYIKDANNCENYVVGNVVQPAPISATATKTDASCPTAANGSITVNAAGGIGPYMYRLGSTGTFVSNNSFNNLKPGSYRVFIKDANNCSGYSIAVPVGSLSPTCNGAKSEKNEILTSLISTLETYLTPNPTVGSFTLTVKSNVLQPIIVQVIDVNGRSLNTIKGVANHTFRFGQNLVTGTYLIKVQQGNNVKMLKGIKIK